VEQELHTFPKYLSSLPVLSEVRVAMTFRTPIRNQQNLCFEISCIGEIGTLVYTSLVQYLAINKLWGRQERDIVTDIIVLVVKVRS
jgi:hypothetical protein